MGKMGVLLMGECELRATKYLVYASQDFFKKSKYKDFIKKSK